MERATVIRPMSRVAKAGGHEQPSSSGGERASGRFSVGVVDLAFERSAQSTSGRLLRVGFGHAAPGLEVCRPACRGIASICAEPLVPSDPGLLQDPAQQPGADICAMWIGDSDGPLTADHEGVLPAGVGAIETERPQAADEIGACDGREPGRHATSLISKVRQSTRGRERRW